MKMTVDREVFTAISVLVNYEPETGSMVWKARDRSKRWNSRYAGRECGSLKKNGYRAIRIKVGARFYDILTHRLAWFIVYGDVPIYIDHVNQDRSDNKISNLRNVSSSINHRNKKLSTRNTSGCIGVSWNKALGKWHVSHRIEGKDFHLGYFSDLEEAKTVSKNFRIANNFTSIHGAA